MKSERRSSFRKYLAASAAAVLTAGLAVSLLIAQYEERPSQRRPMPKGVMAGPVERVASLGDLWYLQSSQKVKAAGELVSQPGFKIDGWHPALVPSTILGTLVQNNVYTDIFVGDNLKLVQEEPFRVSWWYRREFAVPAGGSHFFLEFDGINYRANIWLNGKKVADASDAYGAFRRFSFDVTASVKTAEKNVLAVEVIPPVPGEPTIGFVDWNPAAPDRNMGIWREVRLRATGDVSIQAPFVMTKLDLESLQEARLTISAELRNHSANRVTGILEGRIESRKFTQEVALEPGETKKVSFTPESHPDLILKDPRVWWTHDLGDPELYLLVLGFLQKTPKPEIKEAPPEKPEEKAEPGKEADKEKEKEPKKAVEGPWAKPGQKPPMFRNPYSDGRVVRFGIREVSDYVNEQGHRGFKLNGKKILIRGGGWADDLLLDVRRRKLVAEVLYARHMNLNALRLEGFWGTSEDLYNLCDEQGILLMVGWSCHWEWEHYLGKPADEPYGGITSPEDIRLISESWKHQVLWLRNHPSIFVWAEASDMVPHPDLEKKYIEILKEIDPTRPTLVSTKGKTSEVTGPSRVKMLGPYDYVPPVYWYVDTENGGAYGFNTETGPGPQVPPIDSLRKMLPEKDLWPINDVWFFHCCRGMFKNLDRYTEAMDRRLGPAKDVEEYATKAQFLNYEGMRAMFEAFIANKYRSTGVIQWMYNSAWPKLWWQLYDYFLMPNGAFYGARKAGEPLHLIYNYGTRQVLAANNTAKPAERLMAAVRVYDFGLKAVVSKTVDFSLLADEVKVIDTLQDIQGLSRTYFLDLRLFRGKDELIDANFYALSAKPETLDEGQTTWYVTPVKDYADFTALEGLKPVEVKVKGKFSQDGQTTKFTIEVENPGPALAFQVELSVVRDITREVVLPVFLDDNYISLLPGERRKISGVFYTDDLGGEKPVVRVRGWNVKEL